MLSNAEIKRLSVLKEKSGRAEQRKFLVEGKRAIIEALSSKAILDMLVINAAKGASNFPEICSMAEGIRIEEIPASKFTKLSSTETSQGIIAVAEMREFTRKDLLDLIRAKKEAVVLILDRISDPGNLGTILRSAAWFGVDSVLIAEGSVDVYNPKVVRSAMAAIAGMNILQAADIEKEILILRSHGFTITGSIQDAKVSYTDHKFPAKVALVFGAEASGIDKEILSLCETTITIPRVGKMESLNVGVAASIILSEITRQRSKSKGNT